MNASGDLIYLFICSRSLNKLDQWTDEVKQKTIKSGIEFNGPHKPPTKTIKRTTYHRRCLTFPANKRVRKVISIERPDIVFTKIVVDSSIDVFNYSVENIIPKSELPTDGTINSQNNDSTPVVDDQETKNESPSGNEDTETVTENQTNRPNEQLRKRAEEEAESVVTNYDSSTSTTQYTRSDAVREYVMARAGDTCEGCAEKAPFLNKEGEPYFHAHHVHELSQGGSDTPETVIALCPNCHYRIHHRQDGDEYNTDLIDKLQQLES